MNQLPTIYFVLIETGMILLCGISLYKASKCKD